MANISKKALQEIAQALADAKKNYEHSGDSYDAGMAYGLQLAAEALGIDEDELGRHDSNYAYITTDGHGNMVAEVDGKKYWETMDVAASLEYGKSYEVGDFYGDGWVLADTLDSLYC